MGKSREGDEMSVPWTDRTFLIAEAGVNHDGDVERALALVELAATMGADAVKFQTFKAEALATRAARMAGYQERNLGDAGSQYEMLARLELDEAAHYRLRARAEELGLLMFSTAFDARSVDLLSRMDQPLWKIPSGEITNYPYLVRIARFGRPTILSTGMATLADIDAAVTVLLENGLRRDLLCILHCNTEYPTPLRDVNLRAMPRIGAAFGCAYGYSDHTEGNAVSIAATAMGASVLEKHFTLDKSLLGPDHRASLSPHELGDWVTSVRAVDAALGDGIKRPMPSEVNNRAVVRKVIVAARPVAHGEFFSEDNLTVKRAGDGISPMRWPQIIGRAANRCFDVDEPIEL